MTAINQNLKIYRGDSRVIHVALTHADGTPYDASITGIVMRYRMTRFPYDDSKSVVRKASGNGITVTATGVDVELFPADTDLPIGLYYHELKVQDGISAVNDVAVVMTGFVVIKQSAQMGERPATGQGNLVIDKKIPTRTP